MLDPAAFIRKSAIAEVIVAYCRHIDTYEDPALLELFTPHATWLRAGQAPYEGREAIARYMAQRDRGTLIRHVISNIQISLEGEDRATAVSYWTAYKSQPGQDLRSALAPFAMGEFHDRFEFSDDRWRIARREIHSIFK